MAATVLRIALLVVFAAGCGRGGYGSAVVPEEEPVSPPYCVCGAEPDAATLALYHLDGPGTSGAVVVDATGEHPGTYFGTGTEVAVDGCGNAYVANSSRYLEVHNASDWALVRSIDLRVELPAPVANVGMGIVSRDAAGTAFPGHFTVYYDQFGTLGVRLQSAGDIVVCRRAAPVGQWLHLGINLGSGGLELWIDGVRFDEGGELDMRGATPYLCGGETEATLEGNANPWVIGSSSANSIEGSAEPDEPFTGLIDEVRFSSERRDFSACAE